MLIAWRWEIIGGALTLLSLIAFYIWHSSTAGKFPGGPYFLIFGLPGLGMLLVGIASRLLTNSQSDDQVV